MKKYKVTKKFLDGIFQGLTLTEETDVYFILGKIYEESLTGTHYKVISVKEA